MERGGCDLFTIRGNNHFSTTHKQILSQQQVDKFGIQTALGTAHILAFRSEI